MAILNIITRTHNRPDYFEICKKSVLSQTAVESINWIVGSDTDCDYYPMAIKLIKDTQVPVSIPAEHYFAPYNLYLNELATYAKEDYVMYLDDDDKFVNEKSVMRILNACEENAMLVWKVRLLNQWVVPAQSFGRYIMSGDFSGIGFAFNVKHLPVDWGNISYGDYRVATQLLRKGLKIKWLDMVLTETIAGWHNGK